MDLDLESVNAALQQASTEAVLEWSLETFAGDIAMSSSFQSQSVPLLHIVSRVSPSLPILFLDTGYHFPETIAFRDQLVEAWKLKLVVLKARRGPDEGTQADGNPLYLSNPDMCCNIHKVVPMRAATARYRGWISGIRRDQTASRMHVRPVEENAGHYRVHPMLDWTEQQIRRYMAEHHLPEHPLSAKGYTSIGCAPCTRRPLLGGDPRSGRWADSGKTECGLHTQLRSEPEEPDK